MRYTKVNVYSRNEESQKQQPDKAQYINAGGHEQNHPNLTRMQTSEKDPANQLAMLKCFAETTKECMGAADLVRRLITFNRVVDMDAISEGPKENDSLPCGTENILLVDDDPGMIYVCSELLNQFGYNVDSYSDSLVALSEFKKRPDEYDLIITDQVMPRLSGDQLAHCARQTRSDIPIIMIAGYGEVYIPITYSSTDVEKYLLKPHLLANLARNIRMLLDEHQEVAP